MGTGSIEIFLGKGTDAMFYFRLVAKNGQILATSEGYTRKHNARKGIKALIALLDAPLGVDDLT